MMASEVISNLLATVLQVVLIPFILALSILAILTKKIKKEMKG
jgi:hypothetical protein